ncbi:MAG: glycosyltransferase family 2 protein [Clostridiales bacterium]|nr:glycosyltransferase family 2 protein [Clostridiales bacterium]
MKLLTIAIPCYNSQDYMEKCVQSLLPGGDEVEIIIVDDGSKDLTPEIADRLAKEYPTIVRAIHQENGGHGEAVNTGIANASGKYFKVVDSDDWVNESAYEQILNLLRQVVEQEKELDVLFSNFVYEKEGAVRKKVMHYHHALPIGQFFTWEDVKSFRLGHYILMHSVIYRTQMLRDCGLKLPKHTFYVDNIYVYYPLPYVKTMYYLDVNFYRYFIGREDQSVNEKVMISRLDQQIRVNKIMYDSYDLTKITNKSLQTYMYHYLEIVTVVSSVLLIRADTKEMLEKKKELWKYMKHSNAKMYRKLRYRRFLGVSMHLPGPLGRKTIVSGYKFCQRIFGFN